LNFLIQQLRVTLEMTFIRNPSGTMRVCSPGSIEDSGFNDERKIDAFTACLAFFMGYYYAIFLSDSLVDTSCLKLQTVDGAWSFRSVTLLNVMTRFTTRAPDGLRREEILGILASLLFSYYVRIGFSGQG